jgi:ssDNA-binding Zn-finger/Zn-ribbon topoisomerase 1
MKSQRQAEKAKREAYYAKVTEIVKSGKCPQCGSPLNRNLAISGWWQCVAYPTGSMRKAQYANLPSCSWQGFTE